MMQSPGKVFVKPWNTVIGGIRAQCYKPHWGPVQKLQGWRIISLWRVLPESGTMEDKHSEAALSPCLEAWENVRKLTGQELSPTAGLCLTPVPWVKMLFHHLLTWQMRNMWKVFVHRHTLIVLSHWVYNIKRAKWTIPCGICEVNSLEKFAQVLFFCSLGRWGWEVESSVASSPATLSNFEVFYHGTNWHFIPLALSLAVLSILWP